MRKAKGGISLTFSWWYVTILMIQILSVFVQKTSGQGQCTYQFVQQPPTAINCNPYGIGNDDVLMIKCAITAPVESLITINWFHRGSTQITEGIAPTMNTDNAGTDTFQSVLSLTEPDPTTDSGDYVCQADINGSNLLPSDPFTLSDDLNFNINEQPCSASEPPQFKTQTKCADVTATEHPTTEFVSTLRPTTLTPPVTTQPITPLPVTTQPITPLPVTTQPITPLPVTTQPITPSQTTLTPSTPVTISPEDSTIAEMTTSFMSNPQGISVNLTWIYILVGVTVILGIVIIIISSVFIGMCIRRRGNQNRVNLECLPESPVNSIPTSPNDSYAVVTNPNDSYAVVTSPNDSYAVVTSPNDSYAVTCEDNQAYGLSTHSLVQVESADAHDYETVV